ncbi:hypothetical protein I4U23_027104 [Adineta vaga]|nr:hypothetical protein I4U23_027104 [Adineta vaga]
MEDINCLFNSSIDEITNKIINYVKKNDIPLVITDKITGNEAGSMSSTYNGYLKLNNESEISVIIKYSSFKSNWNYIHGDELSFLNENNCYSKINPKKNEYFIDKDERKRIVEENWIPSELYVLYKSYFCQDLMPTSTIVSPNISYYSFYQSIEQNETEQTYFLIIKTLDNGISLKQYLEENSSHLTLPIVQNLIYSILFAILQLKQMSIIHLDLNLGNIFLMNNENDQFPIRFIDFSIVKFIYKEQKDEEIFINYSENLHESFRSIFLNCSSCYSYQLPIFAQQYQSSFQSYFIEQLIYEPFFYMQEKFHF